jgi:subtilisin family serine protease
MKQTITLLVLVFLPLFLLAQAFSTGKVSPYTAHFINSINEKSTDSIRTNQIQKRFSVKKAESIRYINSFILLNENADIETLKENGVKINTLLPTLITAQVPVDKLEEIALLPDVKQIQVSMPVRRKMDKARVVSNVDKVQSGIELATPFYGKNVVIGIIDNGFEYGHINFYNSTATELRVKRVWNQNRTGGAPTGFSYGTEYATEASILSARNDNQTETHGTHVAGIAAGADKNNTNIYYGVAPEADIALVSYNEQDQSTDNVSIADGIKYIFDYAASVNKPCVINMSLGMHIGPHDGSSAFDQICDALQGKGRILVGAAGNEGADKLHVSETFSTTKNELKTFFRYYDSSEKYGEADIWGEAGKIFGIRVVVFKKSTGAELYSTPVINASTTNSRTYTLSSSAGAINGAVGKINIYTELNAVNNKPNAFVSSEMTSITSGNYIGIIISGNDGTVHAWADDYYSTFTGNALSGWVNGDSNYSVGEIGGTGKQLISVGAYTTKTTIRNLSGNNIPNNQMLNQLASFSSKGPTVDGRMKPDITAPGTSIISSFSSAVASSTDYKDYLVKKQTVNGKTYYYGSMDGTSMATPFVTGVLATWLGIKKDLTPDDIRTVLSRTSLTDSYTGEITQAGSNSWGFGKIDAWSGLKECLRMSKLELIDSISENILLYPNPSKGNVGMLFVHDDTHVTVSVISMNGQRVYSKNIGEVSPATEIVLNLTHLAKGVYVVSTSGNLPYKNHRIILQ